MLDALKNIFGIFQSLFDIVVSLVDFVISSIAGLFTILTDLPKYTAMLTTSFTAFPAYCQTAIATAISVVIVWMVVRKGPAE